MAAVRKRGAAAAAVEKAALAARIARIRRRVTRSAASIPTPSELNLHTDAECAWGHRNAAILLIFLVGEVVNRK